MKVIVMYVDGTPPKEFNNVLQIDYIDYKANNFSYRTHGMSLLLNMNDKKVKYYVDLAQDVEVSICDNETT